MHEERGFLRVLAQRFQAQLAAMAAADGAAPRAEAYECLLAEEDDDPLIAM